MGLPWLESVARIASAATGPVAPAPRRLAYLYVPNGVNVSKWKATGAGAEYELSPTLAPLAKLRDEFTVITGLNHENASPGPDGAGDHSRATAVYLTGVRPKKTGGSDIHNGVSIDQLIAQQAGQATRLPSLELSTDGARMTGRCDSGYSCAYQFNLSWASPTKPVPAEQDPRGAFERLFGAAATGDGGTEARKKLRHSVLDFVLDDAKSLEHDLNAADRDKLDQYFSSVRDVEQRIERAEKNPPPLPDFQCPAGIPESYQEHMRLMFDLMILAFQTDTTRMITFTLANDGSNRAFLEIGVPDAHHQLSHHQGNEATLEKIAKIDRFYVEQFAWFLERMKSVRVGEQSLLDSSMVLYGAGISEGNKHLHSNLPLVLAGRGGGALHPGKLLATADPTPMCNLHLTLAQHMGLKLDRFGDSTGPLADV